MKKLYLLLGMASLIVSIPIVSRAAIVTGSIFCDANHDGVLDNGDIAVAGITVVITNETGSFSNSAVSAGDGSFNIRIPDFSSLLEVQDPLAQIYIETLKPASLPAGSTIVLPTAITNITSTPAYFIEFAADFTNLVFTSGTGQSSTGDWLINDPECGVSAGICKVSGNARIAGEGSGKHRIADHEFGGMIVSGSPPLGKWKDVSQTSRLIFQSTSVQSVICGSGAMDFSGSGTLRGTERRNHEETDVLFTVHVENLTSEAKHKTATAYYLRVFTADGTTLELVSTDPQNPADVAPVTATSSHMRIQTE
jgi:hypothetical protein